MTETTNLHAGDWNSIFPPFYHFEDDICDDCKYPKCRKCGKRLYRPYYPYITWGTSTTSPSKQFEITCKC